GDGPGHDQLVRAVHVPGDEGCGADGAVRRGGCEVDDAVRPGPEGRGVHGRLDGPDGGRADVVYGPAADPDAAGRVRAAAPLRAPGVRRVHHGAESAQLDVQRGG